MSQTNSPQRDVLAVLPTDRDREALSDAPAEYNLHWVDDEDFSYPFPEADFDMVSYTERCSEYVEDHDVDAVVYSHDYSNLVAGVLNDRHDLPGPGLESMFLTNHKYYSRCQQPTSMWYDYIDLETREWGELEPRFPCYVKPAMMTMTLLQHKVDTAAELEEALDTIADNEQALRDITTDFLSEYLDTDEYPIATKDVVVVEKPIEDWTQHCVEGWVDPDGDVHVWAVSDHHYYPGEELAIDNYATPSTLSTSEQEEMVDLAVETVEAHGVENGFWNVEIWRLDDGYLVTEINGRAATVWETLYRGTFDTSVYEGILALHTDQPERVHEMAPDYEPGTEPDQFGGQFHAVTFGEGPADELLDFEFARSVEETDVELFFDEDDYVEQTRTSGEWLARFQLYGADFEALRERADELRSGLLKQPEKSPHPERRLMSPES